MTHYRVRPGLTCESVWHPSRPVSIQTWEPTEAELKYRLGTAQPRKQPTDTHAVCCGGPYHGERILSKHFKGRGNARYLIAELPVEFNCPPYNGAYQTVREGIYAWCDSHFRLSEHRRVLDEYEAKQAERKRKREEKRGS